MLVHMCLFILLHYSYLHDFAIIFNGCRRANIEVEISRQQFVHRPMSGPMFPLSCARARARTAFQPSAHSIFSVPTNLKSFHYYFEMIFCPLSQLFSLRSRKTAVSFYFRHPCTRVVDYPSGPKFREHPPQQMALITRN